MRDSAAWYYSFAVPTKTAAMAIQDFVRNDTLLEVGCGNGYWANFLRQQGIDVLATDIAIGEKGKRNEYHPSFLPRWIDDMQEMDGAYAARRNESKSVFCCYPPPQKCDWLINVLQERSVNTFVLVGEIAGDTGTAALETELYKKWKLMKKVKLPNFINTVYMLTIWQKSPTQLKSEIEWPLTCRFCEGEPLPQEKYHRDRITRRVVTCSTCFKLNQKKAR